MDAVRSQAEQYARDLRNYKQGRCNQHPFPQLSCSGMLPRVADPRLPLCTIQGHMTLKDQKAHEAVDGEEQVQAEWQVTVQCLCLLL